MLHNSPTNKCYIASNLSHCLIASDHRHYKTTEEVVYRLIGQAIMSLSLYKGTTGCSQIFNKTTTESLLGLLKASGVQRKSFLLYSTNFNPPKACQPLVTFVSFNFLSLFRAAVYSVENGALAFFP